MTIDKCDRCKQTSDVFYVYGNKKSELCLCPRCNHKLRKVNKDYYATNKLDSKLPTNLKFLLSPEELSGMKVKSEPNWSKRTEALAFIKSHPWCSTQEIRKAINASERAVRHNLAIYTKSGILLRRRQFGGDARVGVYFYIGDK